MPSGLSISKYSLTSLLLVNVPSDFSIAQPSIKEALKKKKIREIFHRFTVFKVMFKINFMQF